MGGIFGIVSQYDCVEELYYATDYHSHLGTKRGGLAVQNEAGINRSIHDISTSQFRSKFQNDIREMHGNKGIGVISDFDDQPLIIGSHLGIYAIVTVGRINNVTEIVQNELSTTVHFSEMSQGQINPTEVVATLINKGKTFEEGIQYAQETIDGSCSLLILTNTGIFAARDRWGRTPLIIGKGPHGYAVTIETAAFLNVGYEIDRDLGPGEIVLITENEVKQLRPPNPHLQICAFMWVYYGYPPSNYEGINVEMVRYRCGAALARRDLSLPQSTVLSQVPLSSHPFEVDYVSGIPDSGVSHGLGYANVSHLPFVRPFIKYTPTWSRSFMPQDQQTRDLVAKMKLIPVNDLIKNKRLLFCEDSIVRGTQLRDTLKRLYDAGAKEIHMRPACPPLIFGCKYLNFSRSKSDYDLAARWAIRELEGENSAHLMEYTNPDSEKYKAMVELIRKRLNLTSLRYQTLDDLVKAIGLPKERLCTYCWDGCMLPEEKAKTIQPKK